MGMAHTAGLIAAGLLDNPVKYAHIVTSTTHKTLRGPRGGIILMGKDFEKDSALAYAAQQMLKTCGFHHQTNSFAAAAQAVNPELMFVKQSDRNAAQEKTVYYTLDNVNFNESQELIKNKPLEFHMK